MGTRSVIARKTDAGVEAIYCHWDGYPSYVGAVLNEHYQAPESRDALFALGDLSSLGKSPDKPEGHSFDKAVDGYCVAYGRDRGETGTESTTFVSIGDVQNAARNRFGAEYIYYFDGEQWMCAPVSHDGYGAFNGKFLPLAEAVEADAKVQG